MKDHTKKKHALDITRGRISIQIMEMLENAEDGLTHEEILKRFQPMSDPASFITTMIEFMECSVQHFNTRRLTRSGQKKVKALRLTKLGRAELRNRR